MTFITGDLSIRQCYPPRAIVPRVHYPLFRHRPLFCGHDTQTTCGRDARHTFSNVASSPASKNRPVVTAGPFGPTTDESMRVSMAGDDCSLHFDLDQLTPQTAGGSSREPVTHRDAAGGAAVHRQAAGRGVPVRCVRGPAVVGRGGTLPRHVRGDGSCAVRPRTPAVSSNGGFLRVRRRPGKRYGAGEPLHGERLQCACSPGW